MIEYGFGYDEELPRGFQDADLEMRELEDAANERNDLKSRSVCITIRGNVPSYITDLVDVLGWLREHGDVTSHIDDNERDLQG